MLVPRWSHGRVNEAVGTSSNGAVKSALGKIGFARGIVVQEIGYDDDVDEDLRLAVEDLVEAELEDEDFGGAVDGVLMWWRSGDGDLVDAFVDSLTNLVDRGFLLLVTPKSGRWGHVEVADIQEAAAVAGLNLAGNSNICRDWVATRVVATSSARR